MHEGVRNGRLLLKAQNLSLKTTLLTSGDLLGETDLYALALSDCYLRVSINAAKEETRRRFHGNNVSLNSVLSCIERLANLLSSRAGDTPIGVSFLLDTSNYEEIVRCASLCRDAGVSHFSVRRVLGPAFTRPSFDDSQCQRINLILSQVMALNSETFSVFVPWRELNEPDLSPLAGDIPSSRCWQSTLKTVIEPDPSPELFRVQLCGRCRGSGLGLASNDGPLLTLDNPADWTSRWRRTFFDDGYSRTSLVHRCPSCIDRGFIMMMEGVINGLNSHDFTILHLKKTSGSNA